MQITLNQDEIIEALKEYAFRVVNVAPGNDITIDLKAGRGENGYSATLDIIPQQLTDSHEPKTPNQYSRNSGSVEPSHGILRDGVAEVQPKVVAPLTEAPVEVPVVGEDVIDTDPAKTEKEVNSESEDDDADVDAVVARQAEQTKSLFSRSVS